MKQQQLCRVIQSPSKTLLEEMVVKFVFKGIYFCTLHHGRGKLIPSSNDIIGKEEFCAVELYLSTSEFYPIDWKQFISVNVHKLLK